MAIANILKWFADAGRKRRQISPHTRVSQHKASDFWLYDTSRFDLNRVQLSYDFPAAMLKGKLVKGLQIYANGTSLLTLAKERKYMEMNVGTSPQCRSYALGVKVDF